MSCACVVVHVPVLADVYVIKVNTRPSNQMPALLKQSSSSSICPTCLGCRVQSVSETFFVVIMLEDTKECRQCDFKYMQTLSSPFKESR